MDITDIRVKTINNDSKLKAVASITIDGCFVVHDIRVIDGEKGRFVAMPSKKDADGTHRDVCHPSNTETRQLIKNAVISKYEEILELEESNKPAAEANADAT